MAEASLRVEGGRGAGPGAALLAARAALCSGSGAGPGAALLVASSAALCSGREADPGATLLVARAALGNGIAAPVPLLAQPDSTSVQPRAPAELRAIRAMRGCGPWRTCVRIPATSSKSSNPWLLILMHT